MIQTFEPTISLNLESSSINPISFIRTGDNSIFLSNDDSSLIYNFDTGPVDNFDGILSNYYNNIIGFSYPGFYYESDAFYDILYFREMGGDSILSCKNYTTSYGPPDTSSQRIKQINSTSFVSCYLYNTDPSNIILALYTINCEGASTYNYERSFEYDTYNLVLFVSYVSHNISILLIDNNYNTIRIFTDDELKVYESYNYTNLESQIVFGDSVALENGNFIFCYNTSNQIDKIYCELLGFEEQTLQNKISNKQILQ